MIEELEEGDEFNKFLQKSSNKHFEQVFQQEGLFSRRFSDNILADVSTNQLKLNDISRSANSSPGQSHSSKRLIKQDNTEDEIAQLLPALDMIQSYNKKHPTKFHIALQDDNKSQKVNKVPCHPQFRLQRATISRRRFEAGISRTVQRVSGFPDFRIPRLNNNFSCPLSIDLIKQPIKKWSNYPNGAFEISY